MGKENKQDKSTSPIKMEKKLHLKTVIGKIGEVTESVQLYSIIGVCNGIRQKDGNYGMWTGFTGMFEATRFEDGQRFAAPQTFLPKFAEEMVLNGLLRAQKDNPDASIQFAFIIGVKPGKNAQGYEYTVEPVLAAKENDQLAQLRQQILPRLPALSKTA